MMKKGITLITILSILITILSIFFYKERSLYSDSANMIFQIINDKTFFIAHGRYISIITQPITLILVKLNAPLKTILISYSITPLIINYILALLNLKITKNLSFSLILTSIPLILNNHLFYYNVPEVTMFSITIFITYTSIFILNDKTLSLKYIITLSLITGLILFISHPMMFLIYIAFISIYNFGKEINKNTLVYTLAIIMFFIIKSIIVNSNGYENDILKKIINNTSHLFELNKATFNVFFKENYFTNIISITSVSLILIYQLINKEFKLIISTLLASFLFYIFCVLYFWNEWPIKSYCDLYTYLITLQFVFAFILSKRSNFKISITYVIIIINIINTINYSKHYKKRVNYISEITKNSKLTKTYSSFSSFDQSIIQFDWIFPIESLLVSSLNKAEDSKTIYITNENFNNNPEYLITKHKNYKINQLNKNYFELSDKNRYLKYSKTKK